MSIVGETPEEWFTTRGDWLMDISVARNGYGTFDVVARVDGSYAELSDAERQAGLHRGRIGRMLARFYRERGWSQPAPVKPAWPFGRDLAAEDPELQVGPSGDPLYAAVELLFRCRHQLPNDVLRSLQSIWFCASAARFGEPYERFWVDDADEYAEHNTAECEDENKPEAGPARLIKQFCAETGRENVYASNFDPDEDVQDFLAWLDIDADRGVSWGLLRERYDRDDEELIQGAMRTTPGLGCWWIRESDPDAA